MTSQEFVRELDARIGKYDLLCHPRLRSVERGRVDTR